ncbi:glutamate mutase L [Actinokineospora bangkokensis]|uniref:Glutamate mutase n=1 Tax=Actinokineospora bangkokensis TaxID=1193682 RepID=A0A1Q9LEF8_9PSEU|nr:glutamate mutase L [Actinokineospora bangkokensis]OLR90421.1 hypothetical protein BJP25_27625 [Actinokineospora bangkokensis]
MPLLCLDIGSTWTKAALVADSGDLLGTAQHPTTIPEVLRGVDALAERLGAAPALACSSAGGGLRLAVVGQERLVSAEAGHRVALSAGAKVVHVSDGLLDTAGVRSLRAATPDLVLLVGGTDGGDQRTLLHNAGKLAAARTTIPVVLAGNAAARPEALRLLHGRKVTATANVLPDIGELDPGPARAAIREAFLTHVIGGKSLSRSPRLKRLVRTVTPDAVLSGVSLLANHNGEDTGSVVVVDVGGATTDVYSAVSVADAPRGAVALPQDRRTVEGDLGMRWSAPGVVEAAVAEKLTADVAGLAEAAAARAAEVDWVPQGPEESAVDMRIACLAARAALRRHVAAVSGNFGPRSIGALVLSGGVFRHAASVAVVEQELRADPALRAHLRSAVVTVDREYVLAPAGLLVEAGHAEAATALVGRLLA